MRIEGTIDLHCHLLPGIDDGARDLDDAVAMARQAEADGVAAICATPHIRADHAVLVAELPSRRAELETALRAAGCSTDVLTGGEVATDMLDRLDDHELASVSPAGWARRLPLREALILGAAAGSANFPIIASPQPSQNPRGSTGGRIS